MGLAKHAYVYAGTSVLVGFCLMVVVLGSYVGFATVSNSTVHLANVDHRRGVMMVVPWSVEHGLLRSHWSRRSY